jgi:uncharacterized protein YciI
MLQYSFVEGMLEKRGPYRQEHLDLLTDLTEKKQCLIGGAFAEPGQYIIDLLYLHCCIISGWAISLTALLAC